VLLLNRHCPLHLLFVLRRVYRSTECLRSFGKSNLFKCSDNDHYLKREQVIISRSHSLDPRLLNQGQFIEDLKRLLAHLEWGSGYTGYSYGGRGATYMIQLGIPNECIELFDDWQSEAYQRYIDAFF